MTLPDKPEDYIHRIGRVGRADTMGLAISLVATEKEKVWCWSVVVLECGERSQDHPSPTPTTPTKTVASARRHCIRHHGNGRK